jgi:hypothetical protein
MITTAFIFTLFDSETFFQWNIQSIRFCLLSMPIKLKVAKKRADLKPRTWWLLTESSVAEVGQPSHNWCRTGILVRSYTFLFTYKKKKHNWNKASIWFIIVLANVYGIQCIQNKNLELRKYKSEKFCKSKTKTNLKADFQRRVDEIIFQETTFLLDFFLSSLFMSTGWHQVHSSLRIDYKCL